jgi:hypothetical protein
MKTALSAVIVAEFRITDITVAPVELMVGRHSYTFLSSSALALRIGLAAAGQRQGARRHVRTNDGAGAVGEAQFANQILVLEIRRPGRNGAAEAATHRVDPRHSEGTTHRQPVPEGREAVAEDQVALDGRCGHGVGVRH